MIEIFALLALLSAPAAAASASSSSRGSKRKSSDSGKSGSGSGSWSPMVGQTNFTAHSFGNPSSIGQLGTLGYKAPPAVSSIQGLQSQSLPSSMATTDSLGPPLTTRSLDFGPKPFWQDDEESFGQMIKRHAMIEDTYRRCRASGLL